MIKRLASIPVGASLSNRRTVAMDVNDNARLQNARGVLRFFATVRRFDRLAPTGASINTIMDPTSGSINRRFSELYVYLGRLQESFTLSVYTPNYRWSVTRSKNEHLNVLCVI